MSLDTVKAIGIDQSPTTVEFLKAGKITTLSNRRNQEIAFDFEFCAFHGFHLARTPVGLDHAHTSGAAIITDENFNR